MTDPQIQAPEGALRQVLRELETARDYITKSLEGAKEAYRGYPDRWAAEERDLADTDAAIAAARAALAAQPLAPAGLCSNCAADGRCMKRQALCVANGTAPAPSPAEGDVTPEMLRAAQLRTELGAYACANLTGAYDLLRELFSVMAAAQPQPKGTDAPCPRCDGSGEITVMSDGGPDAYEVPMNCDHCSGTGGLADAYAQVAKRLEETDTKYTQLYGKVYFNRTDADLLRQAVEALEYHQVQTRPIQQTINALANLKRRLESPLPSPAVAPTCNFRCGSPEACAEFGCAGKAMADNKELP